MASDEKDWLDIIYDSVSEQLVQHKNMIGMIILIVMAVTIGNCLFSPEDKPLCNDSVIDMKSMNRECFGGAKLKLVSNQWICSCEK